MSLVESVIEAVGATGSHPDRPLRWRARFSAKCAFGTVVLGDREPGELGVSIP